MAMDRAGRHMLKIAEQVEFQYEAGVERPHVHVLPAMEPSPSLMRRKPGIYTQINIRVIPHYIDIVMMIHGVLPVPHIRVRADQV